MMVVIFFVSIGRQAWNAIQTQDLPLIMGTVPFAARLVTVSNVVVDLAHTWLDPRVKYGLVTRRRNGRHRTKFVALR